MFSINDIITLKNKKEYIIIDKQTVNYDEYLLVDEVDTNEYLLDKYKILKIIKKDKKVIVDEIKDMKKLEYLKIVFLKNLKKI